MIVEGLKLMVLGMTVVFSFLALLLILIQISSRLLHPLTLKETQKPPPRRPSRPRPAPGPTAEAPAESTPHGRHLAVITAAVAAHRARSGPSHPPLSP